MKFGKSGLVQREVLELFVGFVEHGGSRCSHIPDLPEKSLCEADDVLMDQRLTPKVWQKVRVLRGCGVRRFDVLLPDVRPHARNEFMEFRALVMKPYGSKHWISEMHSLVAKHPHKW